MGVWVGVCIAGGDVGEGEQAAQNMIVTEIPTAIRAALTLGGGKNIFLIELPL
jgi:hypothetical protein